jgi:hypothetical protein
MGWYGVRTLYRSVLMGKAQALKGKSKAGYFEERVVIFSASSFEGAIKKAEKEALAYQESYTNPFGEEVQVTFLKCLDAFWMFDAPKDGVEVYSKTEVVEKDVKDKDYIASKLGQLMSKAKEKQLRQRFLNRETD